MSHNPIINNVCQALLPPSCETKPGCQGDGSKERGQCHEVK